jgi:diguanylate cyclase (GGDEF)-like protein/PAS domain S-box-containing protein
MNIIKKWILEMNSRWLNIVEKIDFAFQPIADINSGKTIAYESLLREYKEAGFESIDEFFNSAFEEKILFKLDILLREKALKKFKKLFKKDNETQLYYNIDNRILEMDDYEPGLTSNILNKLELPESCLTFEVSEKHQFDSFKIAKNILTVYKEQGFSVALDDFGVGHSGLKMLYYISPDCIKIDRFFITDILNDKRKKIYVANIVNIAHYSGIKVLAEGVETEDELNVCKEIGCNYVQGYYLQRPTQDIDELKQTYEIVAKNNKVNFKSINNFNLDNIYYTSTAYNELIDKYIIASSSDESGIITSASEAFCKISKYQKHELIGRPHNILRDPLADKTLYKELWKTISSGKVWTGEISNRAKDGSIYWVNATISPNYDEGGNLIGYTSIRQDITDKKELEKFVITDHLTKAYNRKHFDTILHEKIEEIKSSKEYITLAILDIDSFKLYNDTYGHKKGDKVIQKVAKSIMDVLDKNEYLFRIGGEEFVVIMTGQNKKQTTKKLEEMVKNIEKMHIEHKENKGVSKYVTASCGAICINGEKIFENTNLFINADMLMYQAKNSGKNKVIVSDKAYTSSLNINEIGVA